VPFITTQGLRSWNATERPAYVWLKTEYFNSSVNKAPQAYWTSISANFKVDFDSSKSLDVDGTIAGYSWSFGDGSTSSEAKPSHTYAEAKSYVISLTVTDDKGLIHTFTDSLDVIAPINQAPIVAFETIVSGLTVNVNAQASKDEDGTIVSYSWNWGDSTSE